MTKSEGASNTKGQDESQSGSGSGSGSASEDCGTSSENASRQQQQQQDDPKGSESTTSGAGGASGATGNTGGAAASSSTGGSAAATATTTTMAVAPAVAALNVYKKVAIIRGSDDVLTYEETTTGTVKSISDLHLAAVATTPQLQKPKPKDDIPVPTIKTVDTYKHDIKPDYGIKTSYVRYNRPSQQELQENLEYIVDAEDEEWLHNNTKFGGSIGATPAAVAISETEQRGEDAAVANDQDNVQASSSASLSDISKKTITTTAQLPLDMFEIIIDILEKSTGFDMIVPIGHAQDIILERLPQLYQMYPVKAPRHIRSGVSGGDGAGRPSPSSSSSGSSPVVTIRHVLSDVYHYWMSKRSKLKRPLLRQFWPVTSTEDTNPHSVFRPREKEKYKLRKKRQNDMDSYRKLQQLKEDFSQIRLMLSMIRQREELNRSLIMLQQEWFEQKLYDAVDTSGLCRISQRLDRKSLDELMQVESHYDIQDTGGSSGGRRKKQQQSRRGSGTGLGVKNASRSTSPVPESSSVNFGLPSHTGGIDSSAEDDGRAPMKIAGQNGGEPAPNFLQPLSTRESYATSWEGSVPPVTTYVDSRQETITRFRHRPRIGRGGRVVIDRLPLPTDPSFSPNTYFIAGHAPASTSMVKTITQSQAQPQTQTGQNEKIERSKGRLLDLLPPPLDHDELSRRIEDICLTALQEDYKSLYQASAESSRGGGRAGVGGIGGHLSSAVAGGGSAAGAAGGGEGSSDDVEENDGRAVVVSMKDWLDTDDQLWGEERYAIGPI